MPKYYSAEGQIQIVVSLLKSYGISKVIASPGTTNLTLVASLQHDHFFKVYSAPEERSAAYMAVGMAEESGEPVVITCTGATASRNYLPGLTEAFYRKLPVLAITATQPRGIVGQYVPQVIDRSILPKDTNVFSVHIPVIKDNADKTYAIIKTNEALHNLYKNGGGPVHINLETSYNPDFSVKELPSIKKIDFYDNPVNFPPIIAEKIGIFIGSHTAMTADLTEAIDKFCDRYGSVVFCDHTSNYKGKYRFLFPLVLSQDNWKSATVNLDLTIYIGGISGSYAHPRSHKEWRVNPDGIIRSPFGIPEAIFQSSEIGFFNEYAIRKKDSKPSFIEDCKKEYRELNALIPSDLPFSNIWIAQYLSSRVPDNSVFHLGILNSLRSWNFFELPLSVNSYSNVGGFGIDGPLSTLIGGALAQPERIHFISVGDLAFFYDMNSLGNRHLPNNIRIIFINNGRGTEFTNYNHPAHAFGEDADLFMAAAGHYGCKSDKLIKHYTEDLGFKYLHASTKDELISIADEFMNPILSGTPMILEVFTDSKDETDALRIIRNLKVNNVSVVENAIRKAIGRKGIEAAKKLLYR